MTTKQTEHKSAQEHIHDLHKKHYAGKKAKQAKKTEKADNQRVEAKKSAQVDAGATKKAGVDIEARAIKDQPTRAQLMKEAQEKGIKYFRILSKQELTDVLKPSADQKYISIIQEHAQKRWKAGWGSKKKGTTK